MMMMMIMMMMEMMGTPRILRYSRGMETDVAGLRGDVKEMRKWRRILL